MTYRHVWPGIDVVYSGQPGGLEYGLVIKPGADPRSIRLAYRGATALRVTHAGRLEVSTPAGDFTEHRPVAYQYVGGRRVPVRAGVELVESRAGRAGRDSYGFRLGAYDATRPVVPDAGPLPASETAAVASRVGLSEGIPQ